MKKLFLFLSLLLCVSAFAQLQTNTYTAPMLGVSKNVDHKWPKYTCGNFYYDGVGSFRASSIVSNRYYIPDTNVINVTFTNADILIVADSAFGHEFCGHSSLTFTDTFYPSDKWVFQVMWPTNLVVPTNQPIPIQVFGVHTNL